MVGGSLKQWWWPQTGPLAQRAHAVLPGQAVARSVQQLLHLAVLELGVLSDLVKCVCLHNLPIVKYCVQQVLMGTDT